MGCIITRTDSNAGLKAKIRAMLLKAKKEDSIPAKVKLITEKLREIRDSLEITDQSSLEVFSDLVKETASN